MAISSSFEPSTAEHLGAPEQGNSETAHLEAIRAPDLADEARDPYDVQEVGEDGQPAAPAPEQITREAFWVVFEHAFAIPGHVAPQWRPLAIQLGERDGARAASDAAYELLEIYYPGALLPGSDTLARLLILGPFLIGKVMVARLIIAQHKRDQIEARAKPTEPPPEFKTRRKEGDQAENVIRGAFDWIDDQAAAE